MKKVIRLNESDLVRLIKKRISEAKKERTIEWAFNNTLEKFKVGDILNDNLDINDIAQVVIEFVVMFVLELEGVKDQDYVRYDDLKGDVITDEEFDTAYRKVMNDFGEYIINLYPEIKKSWDRFESQSSGDMETEYVPMDLEDYDDEIVELDDEKAKEMIFDAAESIPMRDFPEMMDWMMVVISQVEEELGEIGTIRYDSLYLRQKFGPDLEQMWMDEIGDIYND